MRKLYFKWLMWQRARLRNADFYIVDKLARIDSKLDKICDPSSNVYKLKE